MLQMQQIIKTVSCSCPDCPTGVFRALIDLEEIPVTAGAGNTSTARIKTRYIVKHEIKDCGCWSYVDLTEEDIAAIVGS